MKIRTLLICLLFSAVAVAQKPALKISITHLTKNLYVCTSYGYPDQNSPAYPANSLFAVTANGIVLVDTPWGDEQTQQLIDSLKHRFNKKIIFCVATHFHDDKIGGMDVLIKHGAKTYSTTQTYALAKKEKNSLPQYTFTRDTTFNIGGLILRTYYPGAGHTKDNIVVWLPQYKTLSGGCLVKSLDADTKGFIGDADLKNWPTAVNNVARLYSKAQYVIPGHLGWQGGIKQLEHTLQIIGAP